MDGEQRPPAAIWPLYVAVLATVLAIYALTAQRGPAWQDSGIFQWRILRFDLVGWLGLALSHPLLILLGKAFGQLPLGPLAWRINLVSAVCGALAAANVAVLVRRLVPDRPVAAHLAAGVLALAHTPWWLSTICESQMVLAALFTAELNVLLSLTRRPRMHLVLLLGGLNGLGVTAHNLALLAGPVYGLVVLGLCGTGQLRLRAVGLLMVGWAVGAAGLLVIVAHQARQTGAGAAIHSALFGQRWQSDVLGGSMRAVALGAGYVLYSLPNAALPLAVAGYFALRRREGTWRARTFAALAAIYLLFAIRYTVMDQFMFFVPFYAVVAVLAGVGYGWLAGRPRLGWLAAAALGSVLIAPALYAAMPAVAKAARLPVPGRKDLPYRDPARYWLSPWKSGENSAGMFARAALEKTPSDGVILADSTSLYPLLWARELRGGRGPTVLPAGQASRDAVTVGQANVFIVSDRPGYCPAWLRSAASFQKDRPDAILFRVVWHAEQLPAASQPGRGEPNRQTIEQ